MADKSMQSIVNEELLGHLCTFRYAINSEDFPELDIGFANILPTCPWRYSISLNHWWKCL
jgi:hypothetical protein